MLLEEARAAKALAESSLAEQELAAAIAGASACGHMPARRGISTRRACSADSATTRRTKAHSGPGRGHLPKQSVPACSSGHVGVSHVVVVPRKSAPSTGQTGKLDYCSRGRSEAPMASVKCDGTRRSCHNRHSNWPPARPPSATRSQQVSSSALAQTRLVGHKPSRRSHGMARVASQPAGRTRACLLSAATGNTGR